MKFETEHGCVVSEMATAYGNSKQIGRYAIAAAMNEVLTRAERDLLSPTGFPPFRIRMLLWCLTTAEL